jgi:L-lactate dehydrogenase complex protein LldG
MIKKRESFLDHVANQLGRPRQTEGVLRPNYRVSPQFEVLKDASKDELVTVLKEQCVAIHTDFKQVESGQLERALDETIDMYGAKSVIAWDDRRFHEFGLGSYLTRPSVSLWNNRDSKRSIEQAEKADVGITFSDITLAESGTVTLFSSNGKGRSVSLLPRYYIAIIPKSTLVARMTQAARHIRQLTGEGRLPSCINFISGPSNSADIEMSLVVGVHGPLRACYIVVDDK